MSVQNELQRLYQRDGHLTPEQVVKEAENEASPLHSHFEWDDTEAARKFRLVQAHGLIIRCKVDIELTADKVIRTRQFVHRADQGDYAAAMDVLADERQADLVLAQARRELATFKRKYAGLLDLVALLREVIEEPKAA